MDKIIIERAAYNCNLGVTEDERSLKQLIYLYLTLEFDMHRAGNSDSINDTLNYAVINKEIRGLLESKPFCLIETVAQEVSQLILKAYPVNSITVLVKKPNALKNADCAAVEITRKRLS